MSQESPVVILYDSAGVAMAVQNGVAIPASTSSLLLAGSDGTNARNILVDSSGRQIVAGAGVAGTPSAGVLSIQGVAGGTVVPVSGTVTATNPSVGTNNAAAPTSSTQLGGSDGTNIQAERIFDLDTGAGTEFNLGISVRLPASGGSVAGGTATNPLRTDPTGTTTQPISAASLPLPTGAATETTLAARLADATFTARVNTLGQKTMANSTPIVIASDQSAVPISAASLPLPTGAATSANQTTVNTQTTMVNDGTRTATIKAASTAAVATDTALVVAVSPNNTVPISAASLPLPTGAATSANQTTLGSQTSKINDGTNTAAVKAASTAAVAADPALVVAISPNNSVKATPPTSATSTTSQVSSSATVVTILASNVNRLGATIYNDSKKVMYMKLGATATATDHTTQLTQGAYYEVPFNYTGIITGLWTAVDGAARVTELTA